VYDTKRPRFVESRIKQNPQINGIFDALRTSGYFNLFVAELENLRKTVADLKKLGNRLSEPLNTAERILADNLRAKASDKVIKKMGGNLNNPLIFNSEVK
jgi:hypothetical protein